jgi:penicillin-binding protein 2
VGLGNERLAHYARLFGYGAPTGIDLPVEEGGLIPEEEWKQANMGQSWFKGDTYNMAIGQGYVLATPLQVAMATNAIANGGTVFRPHLVKHIVDADGKVVKSIPPTAVRTVGVTPAHLRTVAEGMEASFTIGMWIKDQRIPELRVAAKTGTGEYEGPRDANGNLPTHGWFTAFAPADRPQIVVTVFVEKGGGSKEATPIGIRLLRHYFGLPDTPPRPAAPQDGAAPEAPH